MKVTKTTAWVSRTTATATAAALLLTMLLGCEESSPQDDSEESEYGMMDGDTADCEFDIVTFTVAGGDPTEVSINGLQVEEMYGANKISDDEWEIVTRRGVSFDDILTEAGISVEDDTPVNCTARDDFDPLRTKLGSDTSALPTVSFLRDYGYVYVGSPGDKDPLYPDMEGRSLLVDYDVSAADEVPEYLGGALSSLGMFRWKMIEKLDEDTFGIIEIDPVIE